MPGQIKYYKHLGKLDDEDPNSEDIHAFISSATEVGHKTAWTTMKNRAQIRKEIIIAKKDGKEIDRHSFNEEVVPLNELEEAKMSNFSDDHLDKLRAEYSKLKTVDPSSDNYKKLIKFLDNLPQEHLAQLKNAKIPFLGRLAANRLKEDVEELDEAQKFQSSTHSYGLRHKEFGGRDKRLKTVETWHKTSEARAKFVEKLENKDGFYGIDGYHDPRSVKEESELDEMTSWVGKVMKDGDVHHVWQKSEGGYDYEIQNRKTGKKTYHKGSLDQLERKGYSWISEESELEESGFDYSYFAKMQAAKNRESLAKEREEKKVATRERKKHIDGMTRVARGGPYLGGRSPKEVDTSDPKLHKAFENHLGGSFEHFEFNPKHLTIKDSSGKSHAAIHAQVTHSYTHKDLGMHPEDMEDTAETHPVTAIRKNGKYEIIHGHHSNVNEEVLNEKSVYQVKHDGVPADHSDKELVRLFSGKKDLINHTTFYPDSAKKTAAMLKQKGFINVRTYKDGKMLNEETELDENIAATISTRKTAMLRSAKTSAAKVAIYGAKDHVELDAVKKRHNIREDYLDEADNYKVPGKKMTGRGGNPSNAVERAAVKTGILPDGEETRKYNKHYLGAAAALSTRQQKSLEKGKPAVGRLEKIYKERTRDPGYRYEEVELDEGKMSEIHQDLQDHLDKHIATFKKMGGAEALMSHVANAAKRLAKDHGIEHVHAKKFASDYIDSALKEEVEGLAEGVEVDHRSFEASHGKKARGWGRWIMCKHDRIDFDKHKEGVDYFEHTGNMRTAAEKAAKALKVKRIYVQP